MDWYYGPSFRRSHPELPPPLAGTILVTSRQRENPWEGYGLVVLREPQQIASADDVGEAAERFFNGLGKFLGQLKPPPLAVFIHQHRDSPVAIPESFLDLLERLQIPLLDPGMGPGPIDYVGPATPMCE